jgi:hypothetical protein
MEAENTSAAPIALSIHGRYNLGFKLVNAAGVQYGLRGDVSDLSFLRGNLNPGMPARGTVVFDVPRAPYTFVVTMQKPTTYARWSESPIFRCNVSA